MLPKIASRFAPLAFFVAAAPLLATTLSGCSESEERHGTMVANIMENDTYIVDCQVFFASGDGACQKNVDEGTLAIHYEVTRDTAYVKVMGRPRFTATEGVLFERSYDEGFARGRQTDETPSFLFEGRSLHLRVVGVGED